MEENVIKEAKTTYWFIVRDAILMIFFIGFFLIILDFINYTLGQKLDFTNKQVRGRIGILNTKKLNSPLNKINNVGINQSFWGKIFNFGTVNINTSSVNYEFKYISNPNEFVDLLNKQIDIYNDEKIKQQAIELAKAIK